MAGEIDTRFSFCAIATLHFLGRLDAIDVVKAIEFIRNCYNFDGGFGTRPGSESHAGQVYSFHYSTHLKILFIGVLLPWSLSNM